MPRTIAFTILYEDLQGRSHVKEPIRLPASDEILSQLAESLDLAPVAERPLLHWLDNGGVEIPTAIIANATSSGVTHINGVAVHRDLMETIAILHVQLKLLGEFYTKIRLFISEDGQDANPATQRIPEQGPRK